MPDSAHRIAFGARVRELREAKGWTQEGFAHAAGIDRAYYWGIEQGRRNPTLDIIIKIAQTIDVTPADLFAPACRTPRTASGRSR